MNTGTTMSLTLENFDYVDELVRQQSAIVLGRDKRYLAETRLASLAREEGCESLNEFVTRLRVPHNNGLRAKVVEAMTTNETLFFRDSHPFESLRQTIVPKLIERRSAQRSLSIWSAACSSGQEPYSIAMLLHEHFPVLQGWNVRLIATDLCAGMIERARLGRFRQLEVNRGLPAAYLVKYFQREGLDWQINSNVRRLVQFLQLNLAADNWPALPPLDVIFLRNVLIYFEVPTRKQILGKIRRLLRPDGYLFLGGAETTFHVDDAFECVSVDSSKCFRLRDVCRTEPRQPDNIHCLVTS
ncbi:MAG: protein-glutamate O-methyltransferase CheR [Pirellulales bacterium]|nr:protein-glutamate O-methyltransferase CheR [Pirellulales bacterium]